MSIWLTRDLSRSTFPCDTASAQSTVGSCGPRSVALIVRLADHRVIQKLIGSHPRSSVSMCEITMTWMATRRSSRADL